MTHLIGRIAVVARSRKAVLAACLTPIALVVVARWMIAAPLDAAGSYPAAVEAAPSADLEAGPDRLVEAPPAWPERILEGPEAKRLLGRLLADLVDRLEGLGGYEAIVWRHERVGGRWLQEQTLRLKVRHRPASVYMKDIGRPRGPEIIYVEGQRDGKLISHPGGGLLGLLMPPIQLDPRSPLAMAQSRFPITEAGVLPIARRLLADAIRDRDDPDASVTLDRVAAEEGRPLLRSTHRYAAPAADRPFARVEVHYDPETLLPLAYAFFDWPDSPGEELVATGRYVIESFDPSVSLSDRDFDPANPEYNFR